MNRAGAETMLMNLYRAIDRDRVQFDFAVSTSQRGDYDDEIESLGGRIIHYPKYTGKNHFTYKKWWSDFFTAHPEYRIVHGHIGSTASIYLKIAKKYGCYTIAHSHNASYAKGSHGILYRVYSYSTRYIADYFMGCSTEALVARYGKRIAANKEICCLLNNGIEADNYRYSETVRREVLKEFGFSEKSFIIGTVGRLTKQKNPFFIIEILEDLKKTTDDFVFLWAGTGELKKEVEAAIEAKGLQQHIMLLGVRDDIPRLLQTMYVFILPSLYEGLPVIGVEVQAAGVPMLCSETVSPEVKLSNCVSFLPIDTTKPWVEKILERKSFSRVPDAADDVKKAGYDVNTTSKWLMEFYESKYQ